MDGNIMTIKYVDQRVCPLSVLLLYGRQKLTSSKQGMFWAAMVMSFKSL